MKGDPFDPDNVPDLLKRRAFLRGGAVAAAAAVAQGCAHTKGPSGPAGGGGKEAAGQGGVRVRGYRKLGRTGFVTSDVGIGCGRLADSNVVRYAYDKGVRFFDTAEMYGNGDSERKIGQAMPHMKRETIFLITKLKVKTGETEQSILERFRRCQERLRTPYVDALYMHSVTDLSHVKHPGFHAAVGKLKADGKIRHAGLSSHGPRAGQTGDPMETVMLAAVEDGRFDVMLFAYNFLRHEPGDKILAAAKAKNIGTTVMKTGPARLKVQPLDPQRLTPWQAGMLDRLMKRGLDRKKALGGLKARIAHQAQRMEKNKAAVDAFVARYGVAGEEQLRSRSIMWTLQKPALCAAVVSMPDFESIDRLLGVSGQALSAYDRHFLDGYAAAYGSEYCRHGCLDCSSACPHGVPVSTVMRYAYYFEQQRREKYAMARYAALGAATGACLGCPAPCVGACPSGVEIQAQLGAAHDLLSLG